MAFQIGIDLVAQDYASDVIETTESSLQQLDRAQEQATQTTDDNTRAAKENKSAMSELGGAVTGMLVAYGGMKGVQLVGQLVEEGNQANVTELRFKGLTASLGDYSTVMNGLREATGNNTDDMSLQASVAQVMSLNVAKSREELEKLVSTADALGDSVGYEGDAITAFANAMATGSARALKEFGISANEVEVRMKALEDQGKSTDEAFKLAVLSEADEIIRKVGDAAAAADTPLGLIETRFENLKQNFSQNLSIGVNSTIGIIMYLADELPQQQAIAAEAMAKHTEQIQSFVNTNYDAMTQYMSMASGQDLSGLNEANRQILAQAIGTAFEMTQEDPTILEHSEKLWEKITTIPESMRGAFLDSLKLAIDITGAEQYTTMLYDTVLERQQRFSELMANAVDDRGQGDFQQGEAYASAAAARGWQAYYRSWKAAADTVSPGEKLFGMSDSDLSAAAGQAVEIFQNAQRDQMSANSDLMYFNMGAGSMQEVPEFLSPEKADAIKQQFESLSDEFEHLQDLNKQGLISDEDLSDAQDLRDHVKGLADDAQKAADALTNIKLPDVFGQGEGGLQGQITDSIIAKMREGGRSEDEIAAIQKALDMQSGRETSASAAYNEQIVPMLAGLDAETMAKAVANLETFMALGAQAQLTPEQMAAMMPGALGLAPGGNAGMSFTVKPGDTLSALSALYKVPIEDLLAATGASSARTVQPGTFTLGGGMGGIQNGFDPQTYFNQMMAGFGGLGGSKGGQEQGTRGMAGVLEDMGEPSIELTQNFDKMGGSVQKIADNAADLQTNMSGVKGEAEEFQNIILGMHGKRFKTTVDVEINAPGLAAVMALIGGGGAGKGVPGDPRIGTKPGGGARTEIP